MLRNNLPALTNNAPCVSVGINHKADDNSKTRKVTNFYNHIL
jgi:hypothetical protein